MNKLFVILCSLIFLASCSGSDSSSDLSLTLSNKKAFLIDATSSSCVSVVTSKTSLTSPTADVASKYFSFLGGTTTALTWSSTSYDAHIVLIKLTSNHPSISGGNYECKISGDELGWLFGTWDSSGSPTAEWSGVLTHWDGVSDSSKAKVTMTTLCSLRCGGISISSNRDFEANVTIEVIGYQQDVNSGDQKPLKLTYSGATIVNVK